MDKPDYLPLDLNKESLSWFRVYGYTLNAEDEVFKKVKSNLKKWYPYEYYFFVDLEIKKIAEHDIQNNSDNTWIKSYTGKFNRAKRKYIKELYGLEKKGIR